MDTAGTAVHNPPPLTRQRSDPRERTRVPGRLKYNDLDVAGRQSKQRALEQARAIARMMLFNPNASVQAGRVAEQEQRVAPTEPTRASIQADLTRTSAGDIAVNARATGGFTIGEARQPKEDHGAILRRFLGDFASREQQLNPMPESMNPYGMPIPPHEPKLTQEQIALIEKRDQEKLSLVQAFARSFRAQFEQLTGVWSTRIIQESLVTPRSEIISAAHRREQKEKQLALARGIRLQKEQGSVHHARREQERTRANAIEEERRAQDGRARQERMAEIPDTGRKPKRGDLWGNIGAKLKKATTAFPSLLPLRKRKFEVTHVDQRRYQEAAALQRGLNAEQVISRQG